MTAIPLPGTSNVTNITGIVEFANYANVATNGWFWLIILIASGAIAITWLNQFGWRGNAAAMFFVTTLAILFRFLDLIGDFIMILVIVLLAASVYFLYNMEE